MITRRPCPCAPTRMAYHNKIRKTAQATTPQVKSQAYLPLAFARAACHAQWREWSPAPTCDCFADASRLTVPVPGSVALVGRLGGGGSPVRMPQLAARSVAVLGVPLLMAGVMAAGITPVAAAVARTRSAGPAASITVSGSLSGVAAISARRAWAVGSTGSGKTLILRWNGMAWKRVPSPSPGPGSGLADFLDGVAASSARRAWAVGDSSCGCGPGISLILRWNGKAWKRVHSPTPGGGAVLRGVVAISARKAWVVGASGGGDGPTTTLILQWNGKTWRRVPSPSPRASAGLSGVAATSGRRAWAVGNTSTKSHTRFKTLTLARIGTTWK
jgi:hypothetical protein